MQLYLVMFSVFAVCSADNQCASPTSTSFNLAVASRRNLTGHWTVSVNAGAEDIDINKHRDITIDIGEKTESCEDTGNVQLAVTALVGAQPNTSDIISKPTGSRSIPAGYERINGLGFYKAYSTTLTWDEAKQKCIDDGAHLIVINSAQEAQVVRTYYIWKAVTSNYVHIGFDDKENEGQYVTVLGTPLSATGYTEWYSADPNGGRGENCGFSANNGLLYDGPCGWRLNYICEYPSQ